jgi:signal transduction histidine kinase
LRDVIARAIETSRPLIDTRRHSLHVSIPDKPIECHGDPLRLTQMFVNLINNAAKYTADDGNIWLSSRFDGAAVELSVRDDGKGIDPEQIERIFDLFMQADAKMDGSQGGLGVGLALVRRIAELHGGSVFARSPGLGKGSEFIVRLPVDMPAATLQAAAAGPSDLRSK